MKRNLRIMLAAVALWLGLGMGTANASLIPLVFSPSGNAIFGNDDVITNVFTDIFSFNVPTGMGGPGGVSVISGFDGINNNVVFDSFSLINLDHPAVIASGAGDHSRLAYPGLNPSDDYALIVHGHLTNLGADGSYSGNMSVSPIPEPETYAMLLVGLGFVGFKLIRRSAKDSAVSFA